MMAPLLDAELWQDFFTALPGSFPALAAFTGAVLASFSGVLADRLPLAMGIRTGRPDPTVTLLTPSRCGACGTRLSVTALVPVLGWLFYRGRCFSCGASVPWVYPATEAIAACLSAAFALHFGPTASGVWSLLILWGCVAISWIDWNDHWVPDSLSIPLLLAGLVASPFEHSVLLRNEALVLCWVVLWAISLLVGASKGVDAMSGGDLVLAGMGGVWLGLPLAPAFLLLASLIYIAYAIPLERMSKRKTVVATPIHSLTDDMEDIPYSGPMGPALCASLMICIWCGHHLAFPLPAFLHP